MFILQPSLPSIDRVVLEVRIIRSNLVVKENEETEKYIKFNRKICLTPKNVYLLTFHTQIPGTLVMC